MANAEKNIKSQRSVCGRYYTALSYDVIHDVFVLFTFAKVEVIWFDTWVSDKSLRLVQGGYIFYAGASLAGAGYCRQCRRRTAILPLQLRQGCQVCVKISAQRLPRVAQFNAC